MLHLLCGCYLACLPSLSCDCCLVCMFCLFYSCCLAHLFYLTYSCYLIYMPCLLCSCCLADMFCLPFGYYLTYLLCLPYGDCLLCLFCQFDIFVSFISSLSTELYKPNSWLVKKYLKFYDILIGFFGYSICFISLFFFKGYNSWYPTYRQVKHNT